MHSYYNVELYSVTDTHTHTHQIPMDKKTKQNKKNIKVNFSI